jgi:hypothetical protein
MSEMGFGEGGFGTGLFGDPVEGYYITATAEPANGRIRLDILSTIAGAVLFVTRRDQGGNVLVRETSTGSALAGIDGSAIIYDYEARQGLWTTYVLSDANGVQMAGTFLLVPSWGTWIKSPSAPQLNLKCFWGADSAYALKSRREVMFPLGAKYPVVHSDKRLAPTGVVRLVTETADDAVSMNSILDKGGILMLDVALKYGVPVRYVSVGDVSRQRAGDADRDLGWEARLWDMQVDEVLAPLGLPGSSALTYDDIPLAFDSYISLAASVQTYDDLAAGNW